MPSAVARCSTAAATGVAMPRPVPRTWSSCARTSCPAAARPLALRSRARSSVVTRNSPRARASPFSRRWRSASAPTRRAWNKRSPPGARRRRMRPPPKCMPLPSHAGRSCSAGSISRRAAPRALVRMREQLMDALDHRDDLAPVDDDFVHLFSSWFNRGFLVLRRIDWSTPAIVLEKIIRYEAVHEIRDWEDLRRRIDPRRPALLRLLPSGTGGRAADLRRGGAHPRHPGRDRADPGHRARGGRARQGANRGVLFDLQLPARAGRRLVRQFPDQAGGRGESAARCRSSRPS